MKKFLTSMILAGFAAVSMMLPLAALGPAAAQDESCLSKRDIQSVVASGQILALDDVLAAAGFDGSQEVLSVNVCDYGGELYYVLGVIDAYGQAQNVTLNAVTGQQ
ncbi:MAG: hypothetical protein JWR75_1951 [Devosia sp.]|nr:hypothetical protein [Devosia sp.]